MKQLSPILLVLAVGVGLTYLFWGPLWEGGGFVGGDVYSYYLPQKAVYQEALQGGELALWNDRVAQGYPQLAESQTGVLYPLHLVLYAALDLNTAYHVSHLVHYVLAFCGMALLARTLGLTLNGALLAGLVYAYGWFPSRTCWEWAIVGGAWLPLALWCAERFAATRLWRYAIGLSAVLGVQMLAGHFLIAFMTQLMVAAYLPCRLWWLTVKTPSTAETGRRRATLLVGGVAVACGFGLAAAQLLPTWELKQRSQRADVNDAHDVAYGYLPPEYLGQIVMPWRYYLMPSHERDAALLAMTKPTPEARTNQAEAHLYFGLLPVILLAVGLLWRDPAEGLAGRRKVFWWGVALLSLS